MSVTDQLLTAATQVEGVRDGLGRLRDVLEQTDSVLTVADDVLGRADDVLGHAAEAVEQSKRWAPRVVVVVGVVAVAAVGAFVVMRMRRRSQED